MGDAGHYWKMNDPEYARKNDPAYIARKIAKRKAKKAHDKIVNAPRTCSVCNLVLVNEARKIRHERRVHGISENSEEPTP